MSPRTPAGAGEDTAAEGLASYLAPTHLEWLQGAPQRSWRELDATYVFGDVSGFTAATERLARRGRVGSETLTEAITAVFTSMQESIAAQGGEILKFGGDAVLALFSGAGHEARGATAALGMQEALSSLRVPGAPAEVRRLRMSAGVASGRAHLFLAGSDPRELIACGPLASEVVAREGVAEPGEVLLSPGCASALPEECLAPARNGEGLALATRPPTQSVPPPRPALTADPLPGLPPHLHDHEADIGEHRTVTVAFVQFRGADELLARDGPGALAEALDAVVGATAEACRSWGVALVSSDVDRNGGKLILAAGAPVASPDDDDRMLHALHGVVGREWPLEVRAGVNRGPVFTADIGPPQRRVWSLMGDAVNLAARVMVQARPGEVLAHPSALRRVRDDFERHPVEPFAAKGKSGLVHAESVGAPRGARADDESGDAPLIGRERELGALRKLLAAARAGERRTAELVGEPGLGKSRLVAAVRDEAEGFSVLRIQGGPYGVRTPYLAMRQGLRDAVLPDLGEKEDLSSALARRVRELDPELESWLPLLGVPFGVEYPATRATRALSPANAQERMAGALGRLVDAALPPEPLLVEIEDAHWLDGGSLSLLGYLLAQERDAFSPDRPRRRGYLAVISRRPEPNALSELAGIETLELEPLDSQAARELLAPTDLETSATLAPAVLEELLQRAGGNPLLLNELMAAARAGGDVQHLPDSVEALMNARMDTLPQGDRRLLREASVVGIEVSLDVLESMVDRDREATRAAVGRLGDFLIADRPGRVRFAHALLRDAAYSALPFRRRRELHARAAETAERAGSEGLEEFLAIHYGAARRWTETWRYARIAGERALEGAAPREAAGFLRSAVHAARWARDVDRAELARAITLLGDAAERAGDYSEARKAYPKARRIVAGDPVAEAELLLKEGRLREEAATLGQALRYYRRGLEAVGGRRSGPARSVRARLLLSQGATRLRGGQHHKCLPLLDRAVREAQACGDRATLAHAYSLLDWAHTDLGNPEAARYRDLALPIAEELGDYGMQGRVLTNLGVNAYHEGRWDQALEYYERGRVACVRSGDTVDAAFLANNIAEIRLEQGRLEEAEALLREALGTWRAAGFAAGVGTALRNIGRIEIERDNYDTAGELFARARQALATTGADGLVCELDAFEAERLLLAGEPEAAKNLAEEVRRRSRRIDVIPALPAFLTRIVGLSTIAAGRREGGLEDLRESVAQAEAAGAVYDRALALRCLALHGDGDTGPQREAANRTFERLGVVAAPRRVR